MKDALRTEIFTRFERIEALASDWERLWLATPRRCVFSSLAWRRAAWKNFRGELHAPVVFRGDRPVGILPVVADGDRLRFLGAEWADYSDLLCAAEDAPAVAEAALASILVSRGNWRECVLDNLPEGALLLRYAERGNPDLSRAIVESPGPPCPTLLVENDRAALDAITSKKSLRKVESRLLRHGDLSFRHLEDRAEVRKALEGLFDQHIERWALAGDPSPFLLPERRRFYETLIEELDPGAELRVSVLDLAGRPLAHHLGFETNGTFTLYKTTFNVDYWELSPGDLMLKKLFEYARERPIREFDFTRGDEAYKSRFSNHVRRNRTLRLYPSGLGGSARRLRFRARERLRESAWAAVPVGRFREAWSRVSATLRSGRRRGWGGWSVGRLKVALRAWIHERETLLLSTATPEDPSPSGDPPADSVSIEPGRLSEIARLAVKHPNRIGIEQLDGARARLKRGDVPWMIRIRGDETVGVYWLGPRREIDGPSGPWEVPRLTLPDEETVVLDLWKIAEGLDDALWVRTLREVIRRAPGGKARILVSPRDRTSRRILDRLGRKTTHELGGDHFFRMVRRSWIRELDGGATPEEPA